MAALALVKDFTNGILRSEQVFSLAEDNELHMHHFRLQRAVLGPV